MVLRGALSMLLLASFLAACSKEPPAKEQFYAEGSRLMQEEEYDQAIVSFEAGLAAGADSAAGYNLLGMAHRMKFNQTGEMELKRQEIAFFEKSVVADSTYWPAFINLGASLYYSGEPKRARVFFERALELNPTNPERELIEGMMEK